MALVMVVAGVLLMLLIIVPGYAYASSSVTQGHLLYPVKTAIERVELNLSRTPEAQVKTYEKLAERRLSARKKAAMTIAWWPRWKRRLLIAQPRKR